MSNVLIGPVFSLKNVESHVGHIDQEAWADVQKFQAGMKKDAEGVVKEFDLKIKTSIDGIRSTYVREKVLLTQVAFREYSKVDRFFFPIFKFFGRIINKVRGL